jgi:hypothetical protein
VSSRTCILDFELRLGGCLDSSVHRCLHLHSTARFDASCEFLDCLARTQNTSHLIRSISFFIELPF